MLLLCSIHFNINACKSPYEFPRWFFVIWNNIVSPRSMTVTDVGRIPGQIAESIRTQSLGSKWLLMVIPLKNTIQIKSYGKPAAIAALKSRKRRLSRNLTLNIPRGVLWGTQTVIFCDPVVTISTNLLLIFVCVPHQLKINIMQLGL